MLPAVLLLPVEVPVLALPDGEVVAGGVLALELPDCGAVLAELLLEDGEVVELVEPATLPVLELGAVELVEELGAVELVEPLD
jgi:hypothetical protein